MSDRVLITGIQGFTGRYLRDLLAASGYEVWGLGHGGSQEPVEAGNVVRADISDKSEMSRLIGEIRPDYIVHLAAIAFVAHGDVDAIYRTNIVGSRNLLQAVVDAGIETKGILLASSANIYGNAAVEVIDESAPAQPANDYAVSKLAMEYMARLYADRLPIVIARPFNYTGVGQAESFLLPKIVNHIRRRAPVLELGNLDVARDFSDVRMVVQYYKRLLECSATRGGTFNVCSGQAYTLREVLEMVRDISGHVFEVRVNPAFVRANEVKILRGNREHLVAAVGDVPVVPLRDTLRWMLEAAV